MPSNNPNATKTLVPFKKGEDSRRNLAGRPKGKSLTSILFDALNKKANRELKELVFVKKLTASMNEQQKEALTVGDIVMFRLLTKAIATGDMAAIKEIFDRTEGKAKQSLDITSLGEQIQGITQVEVIHTTTDSNDKKN